MKSVPDSIARFVPQPYVVLGTDGYGFSDVRTALRRHFEVDAAHVMVAVLDGPRPDRRRQGRDRRRGDPPLRDRPDAADPRTRLSPGGRTGGYRFEVVVRVPVFFFVFELVVEVVVVLEVVVGLARRRRRGCRNLPGTARRRSPA